MVLFLPNTLEIHASLAQSKNCSKIVVISFARTTIHIDFFLCAILYTIKFKFKK
jgi:hypothetical protein